MKTMKACVLVLSTAAVLTACGGGQQVKNQRR